jgi:hypothetical protein
MFRVCSAMGNTESAREEALRDRLVALVRNSPTLMRVLTILREQDLPDWRVASGAVFQTVWNTLTGRHPDHGIRDYDAIYFDRDTSWDAEDVAIRRVAAAFPPELAAKVEVRNQARVHLWFEKKFGAPYAPLSCTDEAFTRYLTFANAVGVRLETDGRLDVAAPFGLRDCFAMRLRLNPSRRIDIANYRKVVDGLAARWPEVVIEEPVQA